ncbi:MAG: lipopolysaccharide biosynthesis protein [Candidatus Azobacteroides sp.]|nr:lipopolysaccharide biosynthesis protein [Candidatus Azobacteroides sp.]
MTLKKFFNSEFKRNAFNLLSANIVSQAVALLIYPLITRMYSPEEFGEYNFFLTLCSIFFVLSTGRYETAILQPKSSKDAIAIFHLGLRITLWFCLGLLLLILFLKDFILSFFSLSYIKWTIYLIPVIVLLNSIGTMLTYWFNRNKSFNLTAHYTISQSLGSSFFKLLFGWFSYTKIGLIVATFIGYVCSFTSVLFIKNKKQIIGRLFQSDPVRIKKVAKRYENYPKYTLFHTFVNMLSSNLPALMFTPFFGIKIVGFYALAMSIGFRPINIITSSLNQVYFQQLSQRYNEKKPMLPLFKSFCRNFFFIMFPAFVFIFFFSKDIVPFLFGNEWKETAYILNALLPWFLVSFFTGTFAFIPGIFFKQKSAMFIETGCAILRLIAILIGIHFDNYVISIIGYSFATTFIALFQLGWFYVLIKNYEKKRIYLQSH